MFYSGQVPPSLWRLEWKNVAAYCEGEASPPPTCHTHTHTQVGAIHSHTERGTFQTCLTDRRAVTNHIDWHLFTDSLIQPVETVDRTGKERQTDMRLRPREKTVYNQHDNVDTCNCGFTEQTPNAAVSTLPAPSPLIVDEKKLGSD